MVHIDQVDEIFLVPQIISPVNRVSKIASHSQTHDMHPLHLELKNPLNNKTHYVAHSSFNSSKYVYDRKKEPTFFMNGKAFCYK